MTTNAARNFVDRKFTGANDALGAIEFVESLNAQIRDRTLSPLMEAGVEIPEVESTLNRIRALEQRDNKAAQFLSTAHGQVWLDWNANSGGNPVPAPMPLGLVFPSPAEVPLKKDEVSLLERLNTTFDRDNKARNKLLKEQGLLVQWIQDRTEGAVLRLFEKLQNEVTNEVSVMAKVREFLARVATEYLGDNTKFVAAKMNGIRNMKIVSTMGAVGQLMEGMERAHAEVLAHGMATRKVRNLAAEARSVAGGHIYLRAIDPPGQMEFIGMFLAKIDSSLTEVIKIVEKHKDGEAEPQWTRMATEVRGLISRRADSGVGTTTEQISGGGQVAQAFAASIWSQDLATSSSGSGALAGTKHGIGPATEAPWSKMPYVPPPAPAGGWGPCHTWTGSGKCLWEQQHPNLVCRYLHPPLVDTSRLHTSVDNSGVGPGSPAAAT